MRLHVLLFVTMASVFNAVMSKGGGRGGGGGFRGSSGARSSSASRSSSWSGSGGSFSHYSSSGTSPGRASLHGSSYYVPHSSTMSRDTFHTSFVSPMNTNIKPGYNNHYTVYTTSQPMFIGTHYYYFGREPYYYHTTVLHVGSSGNAHAINQMCAVPLEQYMENKVPLDTSTNSNSTDDEFGANSTSLYELVKNYSTANYQATTLPSTTTTPPTTTVAAFLLQTTTAGSTVQFDFADGNRPKEIVWECPKSQACCYMECCPRSEEMSGGGLFMVFFLAGVVIIIIVYASTKIYQSHQRTEKYITEA